MATYTGTKNKDTFYGGRGNDVYFVNNLYDFIYDRDGNDTAYVSVSFVKIPSSIENVIYTDGALPLPYWIDALLPDQAAGLNFKSLLGNDTIIYYSFPQSLPDYNTQEDDQNGYLGFNDLQIKRTKEALAYISSIINVQFVETSNPDQVNTISFANNTQPDSAGYAYLPSDESLGSDIFLDKSINSTLTLRDGQYQTYTLIHEIGHALGLEHPFGSPDATSSSSDAPHLTSAEDSTVWTVMSYDYSSFAFYFKFSPLDIAALQYLYGPSSSAKAGDNTHILWETLPNFIWDGGGTDTLDAENLTQGATIYLAPGYWGYIGTTKADTITSAGQITVNFGTAIENLLGTLFDDTLSGNDLGNTIVGNLGNDCLWGGVGNDTLDGGVGIDIAKWDFDSSQYQLVFNSNACLVTDAKGGDGTDTLMNIEKLQFANRIVFIESKAHDSYSDLPIELYQFFITAFNAAPGVTYMDQLAEAYRWFSASEANPVKKIVDIFTTKSQFTDVYSPTLGHSDMATQLVNNIVKQSATAEAKSEAINDIKASLDLGWTIGDVIYTVFGNLAKKSLADPIWGNTAKQFDNEIAVAKYYTEILNQSTTDLETLRDVIQPVTQSTDVSSDVAIAQLIGVALISGGTIP
jgi:Ca2+-binding RTX toxin-like protein